MLSRRQFLSYTSTAIATTTLPSGLGAENRPETLSLGYGLYGMKSTPLPQAIALCADIGYRNIEFTLYPGYATEPRVMSPETRRATARQLRELGLAASCLKLRPETGHDAEARRKARQMVVEAAQLSLDLAVPAPPLIAVHVGGKTTEWDALKNSIVEQVSSWAEICRSRGVPLALKAHVGNSVDRPERLLWIFERLGNLPLKVVYDYSHFWLIGLDLEKSLEALRSRTVMIQVKDVRHGPGEKHDFLLPGGGDTDYARYFRLLDRIGFTGPVVVEVSAQIFNRTGYDSVAAARSSYKTLATALAKRRVGGSWSEPRLALR